MCDKTIAQNKILDQKMDSLIGVVNEMMEDRKETKKLLFQLSNNQIAIQEQNKQNLKEHSELGISINDGFKELKAGFLKKSEAVDRNTSFRQKAMGVFIFLGFLGSASVLAFIRGTG